MKLRNHKYADPIKALRQKGSYLEKMTGEAEQLDIKFFTRDNGLNIDNDYLSLPKDITSVPSRDLGRYMNAFTQQKVYMRTMENYAELVAEEARRNYVDVSAPYFSDMFGSKVSETAKEREVNSTAEVREAFENWVDCQKKVKMLQSHILSIEEILFMLSREVSRRTGDFNNESRNDNVQRR